MQLAEHLKIIISGVTDANGDIVSWRHLGTAFNIGNGGLIATCSHIIRAKNDNETLFALDATNQRRYVPLEEIVCHPNYDFAVARIDGPGLHFPLIYSGENLYLGDDVLAFSYFNAGTAPPEHLPNFQGRLFKGHIASIFHQELRGVSPRTCEISFPSIAGFSGTPLLHPKDCVIGMLHGNSESTIEMYKYEEFSDPSTKLSESIHRLVEFGLAHTAMDIRRFLAEMGINDIPPGPSQQALYTQFFP